MKLGLGTAQFGIDYGISNNKGKTDLDEVKTILYFAHDSGIEVIDTAYSYGDSEIVLGITLPENHKFHIITKTPVFKKDKINYADVDKLKVTFYDSLKRLRQSTLHGLLIHNADDLLSDGGEMLFNTMQELKQKGFIDKVGISVYTGEQIDRLQERYTFDMIQVPVNVFDQRLMHKGILAKLKEKGVEIYARSIFLQGLLLMEPDLLTSFFDPIKPLLKQYSSFLDSNRLTPVEGCFAFIKGISEIDYVIVGVNNLKQLKDSIYSFSKNYAFTSNDFLSFSIDDVNYLNPSLWKIN